jgi:hypothetical protein
LYEPNASAGLAARRAATGAGDDRAWIAAWRYGQLVDHADLFWALTRGSSWVVRRLGAVPVAVPAGRPLLILSYHYGQGLWLLAWLRSQGRPVRFLSMRLVPEAFASSIAHAYGRLRIAMVERLACAPPIFTGGARREIAGALTGRGAVYALVDVAIPGARGQAPNANLLGRPVLLPAGVLESAAGCDAAVLLVTARVAADGKRVVETAAFGRPEDLTIAQLAAELDARLVRAPEAWHLWYLWPSFLTSP